MPIRPYCAEEDDTHLVCREEVHLPSAQECLAQELALHAAPVPTFVAASLQRVVDTDSLSSSWARAEALFHHIQDNGDASGCPVAHHCPEAHIREALDAFRACASLIKRDGLFSPNEVVEDIGTAELRYLLAEYYIAALLVRGVHGSERVGALQQARLGFEAFVRSCIDTGVVSGGEDWGAVLEVDAGDGAEGMGAGGGGGRASAPPPPRARDAAALRAAKIERFKRSQASKQRLAELAALHAAQVARTKGGSEVFDGVGGSSSAAGGGVDEDLSREIALLTLSCSARAAVEDVAAIDQELPLLLHRERLLDEQQGGSGGGGAGGAQSHRSLSQWDPRMPPKKEPPPPDDISIDPSRPGIKVTRINPQWEIKEETVKAGIFRQGHLCVVLATPLVLLLLVITPPLPITTHSLIFFFFFFTLDCLCTLLGPQP
jgi:hypothetical protein